MKKSLLSLAGIGTASILMASSKPTKPNILFIVSEDNSEQLGCYGDKNVHTPALDSLAKTGVRFTRAYVPYSVCSPSRSAFLTGLYTRQNGHIGLATHNFRTWKEFKTMPAYFKEAGYYTGFIGKVHVNPEHQVTNFVDHRAIKGANFGKTISIEEYAKQSRIVMEKSKEQNKPFLLIVNYPDAHRTYVGKSKNGYPTKLATSDEIIPWINTDTPRLRKAMTNYYSCMNRLDEGVGMVLKNLDEMKMRDNTMIVYISDHGADFARGKTSCYEAGIKIPMILNYPKSFPKGKVEDRLVSTIDILPTFLKEAGLKPEGKLPGMPLQKLNSQKVKWRNYIHSFNTGSCPSLLFVQFGITGKRFKLVYNPSRDKNLAGISRYKYEKIPAEKYMEKYIHPDEIELFDLEKDPYEFKNLAKNPEYKKVRDHLIAEMKSFQKEIKDPFLNPKNVEKFIEEQKKYTKRGVYGKKSFKWPHLEMFEQANK